MRNRKNNYRTCQAKVMLTEDQKAQLEKMSAATPFTESTLLQIALQRLIRDVKSNPQAWTSIINEYNQNGLFDIGAVFGMFMFRAYSLCRGTIHHLCAHA
jgi:hypothetical protein